LGSKPLFKSLQYRIIDEREGQTFARPLGVSLSLLCSSCGHISLSYLPLLSHTHPHIANILAHVQTHTHTPEIVGMHNHTDARKDTKYTHVKRQRRTIVYPYNPVLDGILQRQPHMADYMYYTSYKRYNKYFTVLAYIIYG
jgi:hypothetical protein